MKILLLASKKGVSINPLYSTPQVRYTIYNSAIFGVYEGEYLEEELGGLRQHADVPLRDAISSY
jgi:hypothetical protein